MDPFNQDTVSPEEQTQADESAPRETTQGESAVGNAQDMGALLEQYEETQHAQVRRNDLVEGVVVFVDRDEVLVDIGGKMEALVPSNEVPTERGEILLHRGDKVTGVVISPENAEGRPVISLARARAEVGWRELQELEERGEVIEGEVVDHNKGGLIVLVRSVRGFVPLSQIVDLRRGGSEEQVEDKLRSMRGENLFLKIIEMNRRRNRLILSERAAAQERRAQLKQRLLEDLRPGEVRSGRVSSLTDFGAFVDLGGADGLIHLSELSWGQVQHPSHVLRVGQEIDVRVVGVDLENKKIALSLKQVEENPWSRIEQKYHIGDDVTAKITKLAQFGAFAEIEPGIEGLVHISELSEERITHPKQVVREGEEIQLKIIKIDSQRHRVGLSLRQVEDQGGLAEMESWGGGSYGSYGDSDNGESPGEASSDDGAGEAAEFEPDSEDVVEPALEPASAIGEPGMPAKPEDQPAEEEEEPAESGSTNGTGRS